MRDMVNLVAAEMRRQCGKSTDAPWEAVSLRTKARWCERAIAVIAASDRENLLTALRAAIVIAEEARQEWDAAPSAMRAGKLLIALAGHIKGYRPDIDAIHAALTKADAER